MSNALTIEEFQENSFKTENNLRRLLAFLFELPIAFLRTWLFVFSVRFVNSLSRNVVRINEKAELYTKDKEFIQEMHGNLVDLVAQLRIYKRVLLQIHLPKLFMFDGAVQELVEIVEDFEALNLAYEIFLEPVERDYPLRKEFAILRSGRRMMGNFTPQDLSNIDGDGDPVGQLIFPRELK
jgi:hypothetical protein